MADKILKSFEVWIAAQGVKSRTRLRSVDNISLEGIARLRGLILELAIRGKLVEQQKSDESASQLLKRISSEKQKLIEQGKIRKSDSLDSVSDEEKSFRLPTGWEWTRLGDIIEFINGYAFKSSDYTDRGFGIVKIGDIQNGIINTLEMSRVSSDVVVELDDILQVKYGDLVIAMSGATTGKLGFSKSEEVFYLNQRVGKIIPFHVSKDYLFHYLSTKIAENLTISQGSAIPNLSTAQIKNIVLALPPLAEQHRIVAKVEELMALCDELEKQETHHLKSHALLVETLLGTLTQAKDAKELQQAWSTLAQHFDDLFTTEDSIDQLKQTILQLAVMGKLVPQDQNDEPASELLERIRKEKERLFNEGEISKPKEFRKLSSEEESFTLPSNWEWTQLGNTGIGSTGKTPSTNNPEYFGGDIPFIGPGQINESGEISSAEKSLTKSGSLQSEVAKPGDILMVCIGGSIGKSAIAKSIMAFNQQINSIRPIFVNSEYLNATMNARFFQKQLLEKATGSATPIINRGKWEELPVPVAPLNEQQRIVSKVNELFALCDGLKARLAAAQTLANQMAEGVGEQIN